jgi:carbon storage regulator
LARGLQQRGAGWDHYIVSGRIAMLVLSRKIGEKIVIGNDIVVSVVSMGANKVRIGIEAPDQIRIMRSELLGWRDEPAAEESQAIKRGDLCSV